jgi:transmembrane sensor
MTGAPVSEAAKKPRLITAGQNIVLSQNTEHQDAEAAADMRRKLAWLQGKLVYSGQPLGQVLADVSRYSNIKVELADATLENLPVGGAFRVDQTDAIFSALEKNFGLHAQWIDPQHVRFTSEREKAATP